MSAEVLRTAAALMRERATSAPASWHPAVTLAVADWLDVEADYGRDNYAARVVADAYLGTSAEHSASGGAA